MDIYLVFIKSCEKTSMPLFEDPRPGNIMNLLPEKDKSKVTHASSQIHYKAQPGLMNIFPSYMPRKVYCRSWDMNHLDLF